jgi:Uma2 family endonuclease
MEEPMGEPAMNLEQRYTYKDSKDWPEDERWELIRGEAFALAAPSTAHQDWVLEVGSQLKSQLKGKPCKPFVAPVDLFLGLKPGESIDASDTVVQPDVAVICRPEQNIQKGLVGAPAFILEVQSVSTAFRDQTEKLRLYEEAGVQEYFVLNPVNLTVWVYRLKPDGRYGKPEVWVEPAVIELESLPGVRLDFTAVVESPLA